MSKQCHQTVLLLVLCIALFPSFCDAQNYGEVSFGYDANGNRVSSSIMFRSDDRNGTGSDAMFLSSVSDMLESMEVRLYPNPTPDRFTMSLSNTDSMDAQVILFTLDGEVLDEKTARGGTLVFDLSGRPSGLYLVRLTLDGASKAWKVLKN